MQMLSLSENRYHFVQANEIYLVVKKTPNTARIRIKISIKQIGLSVIILYFNNCAKRQVAYQAGTDGGAIAR